MKKCIGLIVLLSFAIVSCHREKKYIMIPYQANEYVNAFLPASAEFYGPDTKKHKAEIVYEKWLTNDHSI